MPNWAIVIGIDQYWVPQACLRGAVRDALKMREWLVNVDGGAVPNRNLFLLLGPAPNSPQPPAGVQALPATQDKLIEAIELLLNRSGGRGERFFFYYSGHGLSSRIDFSQEDGIIPTDFSNILTTKALTLRSIFELFQGVQFQEQYFFVDACRNIPWEKEFRLGDYPLPRKLTPPVPPQFTMFATSPGVKAIEIRQAGDERGAFTEALLAGLGGAGTAKVWDEEAQEYVVRWDNLFKYVEAQVQQKRLDVGNDLIQAPRQRGERGSQNPVLGRFSEGTFAPERLEISLEPQAVLGQAELMVGDLGGTLETAKNFSQLPVRFNLEPRTYSVRAFAPGHRLEKRYYSVDLYEPLELSVRLVPGEPPSSQNQVFDPMKGIGDEHASLHVRTPDPLAYLEITDNTGAVLRSAQGELRVGDLLPGFYRARLRTPEGGTVEELVELLPGEAEAVDLESPQLPETELFWQMLGQAGITAEADNTLFPSEAIGPAANMQVSTLLALAGGAASEDTGMGEKLRHSGVWSFSEMVGGQARNGVQILLGMSIHTPQQTQDFLSKARLRIWRQDEAVPQAAVELTQAPDIAGLAGHAWDLPPGAYWLAFEMPEQPALVFAVTVLEERLTLIVLEHSSGGPLNIYQYLPSLTPGEPADPRYSGARFPILRRLELIQRSYISGRLDQAYQDAWQLLSAKWVDPMAGCLGAYLLIRLGRTNELSTAVDNLTHSFDGLSDGYLLKAVYEANQGHRDEALRAYRDALGRGLPIFSDGLALLAAALDEYQIDHPRADFARRAFEQRARGMLWAVMPIPLLSAGEALF